jgi:hypothetical protein
MPFHTKAEIAKAEAVKAASQAAILAAEGVQGIGIGETNGSLAILILVDNTNHAAQLPSTLDNLPVNVWVVGTIRALACGGGNPQATYPLPVPLGTSGGNVLLAGSPSPCASGTIGFKVRDNNTGFIGWISNSHVVGHGDDGCPGTAPVGTKQYQPGPIDASPACSPAQLVGTLNRVVPITFTGNNVVDAGFVLSSDADVSGDILNLGPQVNNVIPAFVGQAVRKNGRTTSCTEGTVAGINMTVNVDYSEGGTLPCGIATFTNQVMVAPTAPSSAFGAPGDSGSPIVDENNNAVALLFAGSPTNGTAFGNPISAVLSALNVSLSSSLSTQVVTRTSQFWFTHGFSSDPNCVTLLKAISASGGAIDLGFVTLPTANRNSDNVVDANDAFVEALGFSYRSNSKTGEDRGTQGAKLSGSNLCKARKQLAVELIAATANVGLLGTFPLNATYSNGSTVTNFPADLLAQARAAAAGFDVGAIRGMTALLRKFNSSGLTNDFPNGLVDCSAQPSKTLKTISRDPTTQATCPGTNNRCDAAETVSFPNSSDPFASAVFTRTVNLSTFTNNIASPSCGTGGRDAIWKVIPTSGTSGRQFTVSSSGSNFDTMLSIWSGNCSNLVAMACANQFIGIQGESLSFTTDGFNTFFIVAEGSSGQYGKLKIKITSP